MSITASNKELSTSIIECGGSFNVRLSLTAEPDITSDPTDIVLVLDRSNSMRGSALASLKSAASRFIDVIDGATDGETDGVIGAGSRMGIVSFADSAVQDTNLITSTAALKTAVNALSAGGSTNHTDAFAKAIQLFDPSSTNNRVIVMFTDGVTSVGGDASTIATLAKAQGIVIYVIGLCGERGFDVRAMESWVSTPVDEHLFITPSEEELEEIFEGLAGRIASPGATNIVITDTVAPCFRITALTSPTRGTASLLSSNSVRWNIASLGATTSESAALEFTVEHVGTCSGTVEVNESITYSDDQDNEVTFPSPEIEVDCGVVVTPEECPEPVDISVDGCGETIEFDAGDLVLSSMGRVLQLDVRLRNVCPQKRVALAVWVNELDDEGNEYKRGLKTMTVPAHDRESCRDIVVRCVKFVLPEDLSLADETDGMCSERNFRARFIAHYIDHNLECCEVIEG